MIFINYRREDTSAIASNLHHRLSRRYGEANVFVDYTTPLGRPWPRHIRKKLESSRIVLVLIGKSWGEARFSQGKDQHRLRLDDPMDWVRQEICTAIRLGTEKALVVVVLDDDAELPETEWNCELDELKYLQYTRLRKENEFEQGFNRLCEELESEVPSLAPKRIEPTEKMGAVASEEVVRQYLDFEINNTELMQLPLVPHFGQSKITRMDRLRIDLPLLIVSERVRSDREYVSPGHEGLEPNEQVRQTYTDAVAVDRGHRKEEIRRNCAIGDRLTAGARLAIVGAPGCGKTTMLRWLAHAYARHSMGLYSESLESGELPAESWFPILFFCRDLAAQNIPDDLDSLLELILRVRHFTEENLIHEITHHFGRLLEDGRAILLADGLDEISDVQERLKFCRVLASLATRFRNSPIVVTSRVVGSDVLREELALTFDHFLVAPLDRVAKRSFIEQWAGVNSLKADRAQDLIERVGSDRATAKLTENILLLALMVQMSLLGSELPERRVDIFRSAVKLMIRSRPQPTGPPLSYNEIVPHLELLAYRMRTLGVQRLGENEAILIFQELRAAEASKEVRDVLETRSCDELLRSCIESIGLLSVAGFETDNRGLERRTVQYFHQSFQEFFASQALKHGRGDGKQSEVICRLKRQMSELEVSERETVLWGRHKILEPIVADQWQETFRLTIADLPPVEADEAMLLLLPGGDATRPEARARSIFALECLADEPPVREETVSAVFNSVIEVLEVGDGLNLNNNTMADEAIAAISESCFAEKFKACLIDEFVRKRDLRRQRVGSAFATICSPDGNPTPETAARLIRNQLPNLSSGSESARVRAALSLMNIFFSCAGQLRFLTRDLQNNLFNELFSALKKGEPTGSAVLWALVWLTGAKSRIGGRNLTDGPQLHGTGKFILLDSVRARELEAYLQQPGLDSIALAYGCLTLTREEGLSTVFEQLDWIHGLARIADGDLERRSLPDPGPTGRLTSADWIKDLLNNKVPLELSHQIAISLGSFGIFKPSMIGPLRYRFESDRFTINDRDEAMVYLALIGGEEVAQMLIAAADTAPPSDKEDFLYTRGLFGLLMLDDARILAEQIEKALPHSDLNAYAYGLAGSNDPQAPGLLKRLGKNNHPRIRAAVRKAGGKAKALPWYRFWG